MQIHIYAIGMRGRERVREGWSEAAETIIIYGNLNKNMPLGAIYEMNWLHSECGLDWQWQWRSNRMEWNGIWIPELRPRYDGLISKQPADRIPSYHL